MALRLLTLALLLASCSAERGARGAADPAGGGGAAGDAAEPQEEDPGGDGGGAQEAGEGEGEADGGGGIPEDEESAPCRVLVECMLGCGDPACETSCMLRASDEAKEIWEEMNTCAAEQGCEVTDFECMMGSCGEAAQACQRQGGEMGGPGGPGGGFGGDGGMGGMGDPPELGDSECADVIECAAVCPDEACEEGCWAESTPEARPAVAEVLACERMRCDGRLPCIQSECQDDLDVCTEGEAPTLTCAGLVVCVVFLCQGDQDCILPCDALVTDPVYERFDAFQQCVFQACGQPSMECAQQQCPQEFAACTGGEAEELPEGLSCGGVVECMEGCLDEARARECRRDCEDRADPDSYDSLDTLLDCMLDADCPDFDFECGGERCAEELGDCQGHVLE